ncbi:MAG: hypothetical protein J0I33_07560 [Microbacterium ginsengisoli]|jgi:hypothetical protein|uniref:hypothetical protein n=1 Tax=unclassified Microbacterium TaxID=2609290 RepID=UPI000ADE39FC|nr:MULTISPECIES: hypothetical protein [unclassified Microbacterium]MBN9198480.1 hypothetical protein [Microbacterium ginsengisoli]
MTSLILLLAGMLLLPFAIGDRPLNGLDLITLLLFIAAGLARATTRRKAQR